ncbi:MAG: hypothetical protein PWQ72_827 [Pseudothermotoga sp.]|uniref:FprA family A-type flavoprotein n=1 Tax=Pseudothermotoga TaxID=1643951 RepID=UPI00074670B7|nr:MULTISPECIES: FprA family A-type flavoprotein [Pseudothermotoga]KUK21184.1 MAG: Beta-lactamase domain protein [Pseudothermotoga lettingae]MDI3494700.1 hypothetical protein [Pseudothermotoga sp.]HBJ81074.1 MBL fold metallo-hydrolase [Pseudothermotoga sp.]
MRAVEIKPDVYWVGVNDRFTHLFEGFWPIGEEGISYNAYLLKDEKNVLIDLAKSIKTDEFFEQIEEIIPVSKINYVVINHMEPDHTGILTVLKKIAPDVEILISEKGANLLKAFYHIDNKVRIVKDQQEINIGKKTLRFYYTPYVHWPETMMTYEINHKILFSCDGFGGYGALRGTIFDDECSEKDFYLKEMLRYYTNIVATFSRPVLKAIEKLKSVPIEVIAPSHGLIWRKQPDLVVNLYKKWAEYASQPSEKGVTLLYGSMYGNTERFMSSVLKGLSQTGIPVEVFNVAETHVSYILASLWKYRGVIIGAPTYEGSLFPPMAETLEVSSIKHVQFKTAAIFGSYGWSGGASKRAKEIAEALKWQIVDVYDFNGGPTEEDLKRAEKLGFDFAQKILNQP